MQGAELGHSKTPIVSMDYMFMGDKSKDANEGDGEEEARTKDQTFDEEDKDDRKAKFLAMRDAISRACSAIPVPRKGLDSDGWILHLRLHQHWFEK